jgi:hypothetical protein
LVDEVQTLLKVWRFGNMGSRETRKNHFTGGETMDTRVEKGYEKYAWIIFFVFGLLAVITTPILFTGHPPNPPSPEGMTGLTQDQMDSDNHHTRRNLI